MKPVAAKRNLRNQQRVEVRADTVIEMPRGCDLTCSLSNLSRTGAMICCNQQSAEQLMPDKKAPATGNCNTVTMRFAVPDGAAQPVSIVAHGTMVYVRRIARDEFQIGIQFTGFEGNGFEYLDRYISELLADTHNSTRAGQPLR